MDILRNNFIANMYGPYFLAFYAVSIGLVLAMARRRTWAADRTQEEQVEEPPEPAEPIDLALLRGDVNEVLRLTVVELVQRGFLRVEERTVFGISAGAKIARATGAPDIRYLTALQRPVFNFFKEPKAAGLLFSDSSLREWVRAKCSEGEQRLERYRLITPKEVQRQGYWTGFWAALAVLSLGGYKLIIALAKGKTNVGFLIAMGVLGAIAAVLAARAPRISRRGKTYIEKLQARYIRLKAGISGLTQAVDESALIFAVALFGMATLEGTPYQTLVPAFHKSTPSSGGCGGAGCGGGGCGGGGCGGGCGGCGGG
jgi:uncharacterized protein (TIGR04222 family)